jgi:hypothetical protein
MLRGRGASEEGGALEGDPVLEIQAAGGFDAINDFPGR